MIVSCVIGINVTLVQVLELCSVLYNWMLVFFLSVETIV